MNMQQLNDLLPSSQWEGYWTFYGEEHEGLPGDATYVVFEYYCTNTCCDCQSLTAEIMKLGADGEPLEEKLAVMHYDWSAVSRCCPELAKESQNTPLALSLLEVYKKFIHCEEYLIRIKSQYARVKEIVDKKTSPESKQNVFNTPLVGRNDPCPCESGKKYKKYCLHNKIISG